MQGSLDRAPQGVVGRPPVSGSAGKGIVGEYLTPKEVADLLRRSPESVRRWKWLPPTDDRPRPFKVGGKLLFDQAEVERYLEACRAEARQVTG
jgi:hypothetical protein